MDHEIKQIERVERLIQELTEGDDPYPQIIEIHPTDICNHKCIYCFRRNHRYEPSKKKEVLGLEHYQSLFEEMQALKIIDLSVSGGGEPTMDNRLTCILKEAHKRALSTRLVTNGTFLENDLIEELKSAKEIRFSLDAVEADTYSRIHGVPRDLFYKALDNIQRVIDVKKENGLELKIGTTFLVNKENYQEAVDFCERMLQLGIDEIIIKHDIYSIHKISKQKLEELLDKLELIQDSRLNIRRQTSMEMNELRCFTPYFKISLNPYGDVYSCCLASQPGETNGYKLGNIKKKNIAEVWETSQELRLAIRTKGVHCNYCNYTDYLLNKLMERHMR